MRLLNGKRILYQFPTSLHTLPFMKLDSPMYLYVVGKIFVNVHKIKVKSAILFIFYKHTKLNY
jgi:hypothetical protein